MYLSWRPGTSREHVGKMIYLGKYDSKLAWNRKYSGFINKCSVSTSVMVSVVRIIRRVYRDAIVISGHTRGHDMVQIK